MNKIELGKKQLIWLSIIIIILGAGIVAGGIFLVISGAYGINNLDTVASIVLRILGGAFLICGGLIILVLGIIMVWTGGVLKATNGSLAEENLGKGTVNMKKCQKCGCEIKEGEEFCGCCGNGLSKTKKCECGADNDADKKYCCKCGKELK